MLKQQQIINSAKELFPQFNKDQNWFLTLDVTSHDTMILKLKKHLINKKLYQDIDIEAILNLGEIAQKLIQKYSKETIIEAMIEDSIYNVILDANSKDGIGICIASLIDEL